MLSIFKRFGWGTFVRPNPPVLVKDADTEVSVELAAQVPKTMREMVAALDDVGTMTLEAVSREWASAVSALHDAQHHFDNADAEYMDTAVAALNVARMRVDVATQHMKKLLGIETAAERDERKKMEERTSEVAVGA